MPRSRYRASCLRRTRFSARIAPDERTNNASRLSRSETTPTIARANCSMRSSCQSRPAFAVVRHRRARGANYCGKERLGSDVMHPWGKNFNTEQIWELVAYLTFLGTQKAGQ